MAAPGAPIPTLTVSTAVTPEDHGKIVVVVGWLCLIAGVLCTLARVQIRWPLPALAGKDDLICIAATAVAIVQTAVTFREVDKGFGKIESNLEPQQRESIEKAMYATDLLFLLSLWVGKLSVSFLFHRLASDSNKSRLGWGLTGLVSVCGFVSILVVALRQNVSKPWQYDNASAVTLTLARWAVAGTLSMLVDITIAVLAVYLVWGLQMDRDAKRLVVVGFMLRLFLIPVTIIRLVSLAEVEFNDFSFSYTLAESLTQLEMHGSIVATTLPCLRLFLRSWNSAFLDMRLQELDPQAYEQHISSMGNSQTHSGGRSYAMTSFVKSKSKTSKLSQLRSKDRSDSPNTGWSKDTPYDGNGQRVMVQGGNRDEDALSDSSRRAIVMRQTVEVTST